jgi:hypothetical protein
MAPRTGSRQVPGVLAAFTQVDAAVEAIRALRAQGHRNLVVYTAFPNHEIEEALAEPVSMVRLFTLVGGLLGCAAGFGMTIWMSFDWPLLVGGKTMSSVPAYVAIAFELTILLGALLTIAAVAGLILLGHRRGVAYDPRFCDDQIGLFVPSGPDQVAPVERLLQSAGAMEVRHEMA